MRILLVEDDPMIGATVQASLNDAAYAVDWVKTGEMALSALRTQHYGLVLLDLGLPGMDGISMLQTLRRSGNTVPLLILTARDGVADRVEGLDRGADDYLLKPFLMVELLARMRALLRRQSGAASVVLSNGQVSLDLATHEAWAEGAAPLRLTNREFSLLQSLMQRPGTLLSRGELEEHLYGWGDEVESNVVEFLIHALRKKLGSDVIKNVRGVGWMVSKHR